MVLIVIIIFFFQCIKYSVIKYISKIAQKINDTKESVSPGEYVKGMEKLSKLAGLDHQNAIVFNILIGEIKALEKKLDGYSSRLKKLQDDIDDVDNRVDTIFSKE